MPEVMPRRCDAAYCTECETSPDTQYYRRADHIALRRGRHLLNDRDRLSWLTLFRPQLAHHYRSCYNKQWVMVGIISLATIYSSNRILLLISALTFTVVFYPAIQTHDSRPLHLVVDPYACLLQCDAGNASNRLDVSAPHHSHSRSQHRHAPRRIREDPARWHECVSSKQPPCNY